MAVKFPEVLSPVGSPESLTAAVRAGADAVYLGAKDFSARRNAGNFDYNELTEAVKYCHARNVLVYLTLNIMLKNSETEAALELVRAASKSGIDAVIVQDFGLTKLIHAAFPELEIHASTQMTVHSPAALKILKNLGICRVVAGREMSKSALESLCREAEKLGMTVEVFVHGALCMSVSGQCLLSSVLGTRSGNRGLCAGPCRLPFSAPKGTGYDLSLKDLSLFEHISELKEMGVASLKIEGRMKRPEYVAAATFACRQAVDSGVVSPKTASMLGNVFSRSGFTDGYFTDRLGREMFGIRTKDDVLSAPDTFAELHELTRTERQSVPITVSGYFAEGEAMRITLSDGKHSVTEYGETAVKANSKPATLKDVTASLEKLGGTPYYAEKTDIDLKGELFLPSAKLNALRRNAIGWLTAQRQAVKERSELPVSFDVNDCKHEAAPQIYIRVPSLENLPTALEGVSAIIFPSETTPRKIPDGIELIAETPRYIESENQLLSRLDVLRQNGIKSAFCSNISAVELAKESGMKIIGGMGLNVCNSKSAEVCADAGIDRITLSQEIALSDAVSMKSPIKKGIFAYGRIPLMLLRNCPLKNGRTCKDCDRKGELTDRKGVSFPVRCRPGYSELLNSLPLFLADKKAELSGLDYIILWFNDESPEEISRIISDYRNGSTADFNRTRGLYFRFVP